MGEWLDACARLGVPSSASPTTSTSRSPTAAGAANTAQFCPILSDTRTANFRLHQRVGARPNAVSQARSTRASAAPRDGGHRRRRDRRNGGSPPCNHRRCGGPSSEIRSGALDAMVKKAANGYDSFCRQDLIGADYGLLDCGPSLCPTITPRCCGRRRWDGRSSTSARRAAAAPTAAPPRPSGSTLTAPPRPSRRASRRLAHCARDQPRERERTLASPAWATSRAYVLQATPTRAPRSPEWAGCSAPVQSSTARRSAPPPTAPPELTPATDLGREVTLPPTSLAWLVVPGAARKECGGQS